MTEFKPFSGANEQPQPEERTVAVVLSIPTDLDDPNPIALRPMGRSSLALLALTRLAAVEADDRWLLSMDPAIDELFKQGSYPGVTLTGPSTQSAASQPTTSHLLLLGPYHPFLRPSSISEAVRLFKMRLDIATLQACTRSRDALYDESGEPVVPEHDMRGLYRAAHAFQILPRTPAHKSGSIDPYPFELSAQEAFLVDTEFEFDLAAAWFERKADRGPC